VTQERRLGRGLQALLGRPLDGGIALDEPPALGGDAAAGGIERICVFSIDSNPQQPRQAFDDQEIEALADSIREHGLLQPVVVRRNGERYQIIAGERRLRAAIKAGFDHVLAQVKEAGEREMAELALVENLQRKDLNPLEKATAFQSYLHRYGCTQEELASRLKLDRSTIANLIRLLELPATVQDAVRQGRISQGHARALLPLGDEREQVAFLARIEKEGLSVRATESLVQEAVRRADAERLTDDGDQPHVPIASSRMANLADLEQEFRAALGTKVDVRQTASGRGRIVIHFASHEEFERLRCHLHGQVGQPRLQAG
jgi:ParB family chromosome partitioning protein